MLSKIVNITKRIDRATGGAIRWCWLESKAVWYWPELYLIRRKIKSSVGRQAFRNAKRASLAVFPDGLPKSIHLHRRDSALEKIFLACDMSPKPYSASASAQIVVNWQLDTKETIEFEPFTSEGGLHSDQTNKQSRVINGRCTNISKQKVGLLNAKIFGYELDVDPTSYVGNIVQKSDENGLHDGKVITSPIAPADVKSGCVYSVLIDSVKDEYAIDFRLIYMNGLLEFFYEKKRPVANRFANANSGVSLRSLADEFSPLEIQNINTFCHEIGADYGELDVLRDTENQRLYIVDFAKTPIGPPHELPKRERRSAIAYMSVEFIKNFLPS